MFLSTRSSRELEKVEASKPIANFKQKKKDLIERLRAKKAEAGMNMEEHECLSHKNHLSRASKKRFYAGATTQDPYYISSSKRLSQTDYMKKTLLLALQDNGEICPYSFNPSEGVIASLNYKGNSNNL